MGLILWIVAAILALALVKGLIKGLLRVSALVVLAALVVALVHSAWAALPFVFAAFVIIVVLRMFVRRRRGV